MDMIGYQSTPLSKSEQEFKFAFVGYADILGFAKMLKEPNRKKTIVEAYSQIRDLLQKGESTEFPIKVGTLSGSGNLVGTPWYHIISIDSTKIFMLSDSIFFIIIPDRDASEIRSHYGLASVQLMSRILSICWHFNLPARGALSDGKVYFDSDKSMFIGEPIVHAVRWEAVQSFVWFSAEPTSWLAQNVYNHPNARIGKEIFQIKIEKTNYNSDRLKTFEGDCGKINIDSTFTCGPDLTFELNEESSNENARNFLFLSPDEIFVRFDHYRNLQESKEKRYWKNTEDLFRKMGFTKDNFGTP